MKHRRIKTITINVIYYPDFERSMYEIMENGKRIGDIAYSKKDKSNVFYKDDDVCISDDATKIVASIMMDLK